MNILLIGRSGQVGQALERLLHNGHDLIALDRSDLDLTDQGAITSAIDDSDPDVVINAAAYTAVDRAESEPELATAINATAPGLIAEASAAAGAWIIHYSTDYVFDGSGTRPYRESDLTQPLGTYGRTKWEGEEAVRRANAEHLILRTSWVYTWHGHNFLLTMLRLASERDLLKVVDDQIGSPTYAEDLASMTVSIIEKLEIDELNSVAGTYHITHQGQTNWCDFARKIFILAGIKGVEVEGIPTEAYPTPAPRPRYSVLDGDRLKRVFNLEMPGWESGLRRCIEEGGLARSK
ncbi:MAG: dTDP-4-dehydrorhamnose reductase [Arenicellales bacterium]|jgi:dTDP-4-dehydrorhamnose reductase|nr:dTDP-4-dehydrorhamnose reductase [Arenicellales bacterium]MDP7522148.1 dTDP-4-dehydrorhamnose reductase [Arenicellales bacterium]HJL66801.1 dTDP-4-dehydrorhamnose reductase [Arenicellales bacterium]|tara:strand:+ start:1182 stop:2060 length:879 start_codon:yes stop_codon:yes gene_type:complete